MTLKKKILESKIDFSKKTTKEVSKILFGETKSTYIDQISAIFKQENIKYLKTSGELKNKRERIFNFFKNCKEIDSKNGKDWAKHFNVGVSLIFNILKELDIKKYKTGTGSRIVVRNKPIKIYKDLNQIIIGSLLGDGSMLKHPRNINSSLVIKHGIKQKGYAKYKYDLISKYCKVSSFHEYKRIDLRKNWPTEQISVDFSTSRNKSFNKYRDEWYPNGVKIIPKSVSSITPLALAIWYMDDGSKAGNNGYSLATMCFNKLDIEYLRNILYINFKIKCSIWKHNILYIKSESKNIFTELIKPFIHKSMLYKLHS
jgi:hypothetical protein